MSGKKGQRSRKAATVPAKYVPGIATTPLNKRAVMDRRTRAARWMRDAYAALTDSLGGKASMSYQQRSLCERTVHMEALIRTYEQRLLAGMAMDDGSYRGHINTLIGLYRTLGIKRAAARVPRALEYAAEVAKREGQTP